MVCIPPSVGVIARNQKGEIALIRTWRYVNGRLSVEVPTGCMEPGETSLQAAKRELLEETGLVAQLWQEIYGIDTSNGVTTDTVTLFLAEELTLNKQLNTRIIGDEFIDDNLLWVPLTEAIQLVRNDMIRQSTSKIAILQLALL